MEYTEEKTEYLRREYETDPSRATVDRLAEEYGVSFRSIIGKLTSMGIYQKPQRLNKAGMPVELKKDLSKEIGDMFGLELPSLVKAEREDLRMLRDALLVPENLEALLVDLR